jgi:hypothetical protein
MLEVCENKEAKGGHPIRNHIGKVVFITSKSLKTLKLRHYLYRHKVSGLYQFKPALYPVYLDIENADVQTKLYKELGRDLSGRNTVNCTCKDCQREAGYTDNTPIPGSSSPGMSQGNTTRLVEEVKSRRKYV